MEENPYNLEHWRKIRETELDKSIEANRAWLKANKDYCAHEREKRDDRLK